MWLPEGFADTDFFDLVQNFPFSDLVEEVVSVWRGGLPFHPPCERFSLQWTDDPCLTALVWCR